MQTTRTTEEITAALEGVEQERVACDTELADLKARGWDRGATLQIALTKRADNRRRWSELMQERRAAAAAASPLAGVLLEEEVCRNHVKALRRELVSLGNAYIRRRREGGHSSDAATLLEQIEATRAEIAERETHYTTLHSDKLLAMLEADAKMIRDYGLDGHLAAETNALLGNARAWRRDLLRR